MITFRPLRQDDAGTLLRWLSCGEARRWFGGDEELSLRYLRAKYIDDADGPTQRRLVLSAGAIVGYVQWYRIADYPDYAAQIGAKPGDYGLDLFIGDDGNIGRGLGTKIVRAALRTLVFADAGAVRCVLGPSPENRRAIRCYEKCGFSYLHTARVDGEDEYIMAVARNRRQTAQWDDAPGARVGDTQDARTGSQE